MSRRRSAKIAEQTATHGYRIIREWIWGKLGRSPDA
jgi:hypothetical protein